LRVADADTKAWRRQAMQRSEDWREQNARADKAESALAALRAKHECGPGCGAHQAKSGDGTWSKADQVEANSRKQTARLDSETKDELIVMLRRDMVELKDDLAKSEQAHAALRKRVDESARAVLQEGPGGRGYVKAHLSRVRNEGVPIGVPVALVVLDEG